MRIDTNIPRLIFHDTTLTIEERQDKTIVALGFLQHQPEVQELVQNSKPGELVGNLVNLVRDSVLACMEDCSEIESQASLEQSNQWNDEQERLAELKFLDEMEDAKIAQLQHEIDVLDKINARLQGLM
jgi:hypothetical protein